MVGRSVRMTSQEMPASFGVQGPGEMTDALGLERRDFVEGDFVVALHQHLRAEFAEVLDEVVGEGVVVIEDEEHGERVSWNLLWRGRWRPSCPSLC